MKHLWFAGVLAMAPAFASWAQAGAEAEAAKALAEAAKEAGAVVTPSGLVYRSLKDGSGAAPKATDKITVHYRGTLPSGKEFDSSHKRGAPAEFRLDRTVPCWTEGMQRMKIGGQAKITCPAALAYGARGAGGVIPPNSALHFEIELLGIGGR